MNNSSDPRTIDNLGPDASRRYAKAIEATDEISPFFGATPPSVAASAIASYSSPFLEEFPPEQISPYAAFSPPPGGLCGNIFVHSSLMPSVDLDALRTYADSLSFGDAQQTLTGLCDTIETHNTTLETIRGSLNQYQRG